MTFRARPKRTGFKGSQFSSWLPFLFGFERRTHQCVAAKELRSDGRSNASKRSPCAEHRFQVVAATGQEAHMVLFALFWLWGADLN